MTTSKLYLNSVRALPLFLAFAALPGVYGDTLYSDPLPTTNLNGTSSSRTNAAPIYGSLPDPNFGDASEPFILGDQFNVTGEDAITSVTVYEVAANPADTTSPDQEFASASLYLGVDGTDLTLASTLNTAALAAINTQTFYTGATSFGSLTDNTATCTSGPSSSPACYPIFALTFAVPNFIVTAGTYDFAVGYTDCATVGVNNCAQTGSSFALSASTGASSPNGFLFFQEDGASGPPTATYQCVNGGDTGGCPVANFNNPAFLDINGSITASAVPEPTTFGLFVLGIGGLLGLRKRIRG